jgi:hypothetical protein
MTFLIAPEARLCAMADSITMQTNLEPSAQRSRSPKADD